MIILGLDCSSKQSSVCIMQDEKVIYTAVQSTNITHSQNLMPMVDYALKTVDLTIKEVDLFAVTLGPGSFTGLRIGLRAIKGMAAAENKDCIGVSSLKALAECVDFDGVIVPCFDARRNQIYGAVIDGEQTVKDDFCEDIHILTEYVNNCQKKICFVGDGRTVAERAFSQYENVICDKFDMPCIAMGACKLAKKEYEKNGAVKHFDLSPSYLRLSQAERELKEKTEAKK